MLPLKSLSDMNGSSESTFELLSPKSAFKAIADLAPCLRMSTEYISYGSLNPRSHCQILLCRRLGASGAKRSVSDKIKSLGSIDKPSSLPPPRYS